MKNLSWICLIAVFSTLTLMAQNVESLRKERDKLEERGMWRDAVNFYEEKLMPISDARSGEDLTRTHEALRRLNAWGEFDGLVERSVSAHSRQAKA